MYIGSIYEKLDKLEQQISALEHILDTEDDEDEKLLIEEELDKLYTRYHKLMDS